MISIVIPAYNYAEFLPAAIDSVLSQGIEAFEIVICDDASTDDTQAVAAAYLSDARFRYYRNPINYGASANINYAMSLAQGEYVLLLGADDFLEPGALPALLETLEQQPQCGFAYGRYRVLTAAGQLHALQHPGWLDHGYIGGRNEFADLLQSDCYINLGTTLFRRAVLPQPFFDSSLISLPGERFFRATDWNLMLSLALAGVEGAFLDRSLAVFRQHAAQASGVDKYAASGVAIVEHMRLLESYLTEENLPRVQGHLAGIFHLLCGKYAFYLEQGHAASLELDRAIRRQFHQVCLQMEPLFRLDPSSVLTPPLDDLFAQSLSGPDAQGPMFSVIVATYKRPRLLQDALASILAQTCQDFEILVVNDGGDLVENALGWIGQDVRISYIRQPNRGPSGARNAALKLARGHFVVFLDDDDLMLPEHLETLKQQLQLSPRAVVYTDPEMVIESLEGGLRREHQRMHPYPHEEYDKARLQVVNYIPVNTFAFARSWLDTIGLFDESLPALEDWDLLIRLSRQTEFIHVRKVTVEIRQRQDKHDHQTARELSNLKQLFRRVYAKYDDMNDQVVRVGRASLLSAENPGKASLASMEYRQWLNEHALREVDGEVLAERMMKVWKHRPVLTMLMKVSRAQLDALGVSIRSLQQQFYQSWRLIIVADFDSPDPIFTSTDLLGWLQIDSVENDEQFTQACNAVVTDLHSDWVGLIPPGAEFEADWLLRIADRIESHGQLVALYCDHDRSVLPGSYDEPQFKPDFNLDYLLSRDYIGLTAWFSQQAIMSVGGFEPYPGVEGYELMLRLAQRFGHDKVAHVPRVLLHLPEISVSHLSRAARQVAIESHLRRIGREGSVQDGAASDTFRIAYALQGTPLVSIVIPNRDKLEFLQPCIESLLAKTAYRAFEILVVDNQSQDPDVLDYYAALQESLPTQVRILSYDAAFNFSAQCNLGVSEARGEYVLLLNNDTEVVQPEWLERMLAHAQREEVGIVGAKLVFPETGLVQHAGIVLGSGTDFLSVAGHYGVNQRMDDAGYMQRLQCDMSMSAVTGACMLVRRALYQQVGGYNEELGVLYNDVDFCLRVAQQGSSIVWTPYALMVHHHGQSVNARLSDPVTLGKYALQSRREYEYVYEKWLPVLANDPAYNRNLSLYEPPLNAEMHVPCTWEPAQNERPKILASAVAGGSGEYRVIQPLTGLAQAGMAQVCCVRLVRNGNRLLKPVEIERLAPDVLVMQNGISDQHMEAMKLYKRYFPEKLRLLTLDDLMTDLPEKSSLYRSIKSNFRDARRRLRESLSLVDRLIVSTEPLAEFASEFIGDIHIVPNRLVKKNWWNLQSQRGVGQRPRVGWVGAQQHKGDLELMNEVIRATAHEVEWVFMGMWPEGLDDCLSEKHRGVSFGRYPSVMAGLNLDLAIAPLEQNAFNEGKSNLRLLEYGAMGWPVIASDIYPYQTNNAPVKRVPNTAAAWIAAIRERIHDLPAAYREGDALRAWVARDYLLEDHLEEWMMAYQR
jgi:glycosyltransferase involved in cell wall biosynthesis